MCALVTVFICVLHICWYDDLPNQHSSHIPNTCSVCACVARGRHATVSICRCAGDLFLEYLFCGSSRVGFVAESVWATSHVKISHSVSCVYQHVCITDILVCTVSSLCISPLSVYQSVDVIVGRTHQGLPWGRVVGCRVYAAVDVLGWALQRDGGRLPGAVWRSEAAPAVGT